MFARQWSEVFRRSKMDPRVYGVVPTHEPRIRAWLDSQDVPCVVSRDLYSPTVYGWAVLDGGCSEIHRYGLTSLPSGIRVVGTPTLRLLIADLDLRGTPRPLAGEPFVEVAELRLRHAGDAARGPEAQRRAELLASCEDGDTMRSVAEALLGPAPGTVAAPAAEPAPRERPPGPMGPWRSEHWVEQQLADRREKGQDGS